MSKIRVTQIKSSIGRTENQKKNLIALGLNKINKSKEFDNTPMIMGMINKVSHLVKVENI